MSSGAIGLLITLLTAAPNTRLQLATPSTVIVPTNQPIINVSGDTGLFGGSAQRHPGGIAGDDVHRARGGDGGDREPQRSAGRPAGEVNGEGDAQSREI